MALFLQVLGMVFIAELGDKTQFLMIAMASKYRIRDILLGVGGAICVLNVFAIIVGTLLGGVLPTDVISLVAGIAFLCFAYMAIGGKDEEGEHCVKSKVKSCAVVTIFGTFFLAELGDKTQLTALTLAADSSSGGFDIGNLVLVFLGASIALFAADVLGLLIGYFLGKTLPSSVFAWISFAIFAVFGAIKLLSGFEGILTDISSANLLSGFEGILANIPIEKLLAIACTSALCVIFATLSIIKVLRGKKNCPCEKRDGDKE